MEPPFFFNNLEMCQPRKCNSTWFIVFIHVLYPCEKHVTSSLLAVFNFISNVNKDSCDLTAFLNSRVYLKLCDCGVL